MSAQSDMEFILIQTIENYAAKHQISTQKTAALFQEKQIASKLISQYEYLHQLDLSEALTMAEEYLTSPVNRMYLYHGSSVLFDGIDLEKSQNRRDFGRGFYTTVLKSQAQEWSKRLCQRRRSGYPVVYEYEFTVPAALRIKQFDALNEEWLEFIRKNRTLGGIQHDYDVVIGPVADDNTMETIQLYTAGILSGEEAVSRLRYSKVNNQVSFHTADALEHLKRIGREIDE